MMFDSIMTPMIISAVSSFSNCCACGPGSDQIERTIMWHHTYDILRNFYLLAVLLGTVPVAAVNLWKGVYKLETFASSSR